MSDVGSEKLTGSVFQFQLKFGDDGLIPAIVQDAASGEVLMMAYMNREALDRTLETNETWFYSRSRKELWHKGETSGNVQRVKGISFDCDRDTLLIKVEPEGAACHEGYQSCFYRQFDGKGGFKLTGSRVFDPEVVYGGNTHSEPEPTTAEATPETSQDIINDLYQIILGRKEQRPEGSYTTYLFNQGLDKMCKKIGEEAAEIIIAAKNRSRDELIYESADFLYHLLVVLAEAGIRPEAVMQELSRRRTPGSK